MKKILKASNWKYVIAFLVPTFAVLILCGRLDNDSWGVLAEGRYIVENGIYYEDVLSMHEGLHVVVQNYAFAALFYLIYSALGPAGIYCVMLGLNFLILWLLYKICMLISNKNVKLSLIVMAATDMLLACGFIVTRAQMIDYVVFLVLIYVLELFIKTDKIKYLGWIPLLSLVLANMHASVWWIIFAIMAAYLVDAIKQPILKLQGYRWWPLLMTTAISAVVGLINPYGVEMVTAIFSGYGGLAELDLVNELKAFNPLWGMNLLYYLAIAVVITLYAFGKGKNVRVRYLLMFFGFLMIGLSSIKGMSELLLTMIFPLALLYKNWKVPTLFNNKKIGKIVTMWVGVVVMCVTVGLAVMVLRSVEDDPGGGIMKEAMNAIDEEVGDRNKRELKIYVGYNQGGYVEYRGYPAYLDPRGAEFLQSVNGETGILDEWVDLKEGKLGVKDFLDKYAFDFLVVEEYEEKLYKLDDQRYELIYNYDDTGEKDEINGLRVYKKIET